MSRAPARRYEARRGCPRRVRWLAATLCALLVGCSGAEDGTEGAAPSAVTGRALGSKPCTGWVLQVLSSPGLPDELRLDLTYAGRGPKGQVFAHYAVIVNSFESDPPVSVESLIHGEPPSRPLETVHLDSRQRPVYAISDWYRPGRPKALFLIRLPSPQPDLAALGLEIGPYEPLGGNDSGLASKHMGRVPPKLLLLEPATIEGLDERAEVCRANGPPG